MFYSVIKSNSSIGSILTNNDYFPICTAPGIFELMDNNFHPENLYIAKVTPNSLIKNTNPSCFPMYKTSSIIINKIFNLKNTSDVNRIMEIAAINNTKNHLKMENFLISWASKIGWNSFIINWVKNSDLLLSQLVVLGTKYNLMPILECAKNRRWEMCSDPNSNSFDEYVISIAPIFGRLNIIKYYWKNEFESNDRIKYHILFMATKHAHMDIIKWIEEKISLSDALNNHLSYLTAKSGRIDIMEYLFSKINTNKKNDTYQMAMIGASNPQVISFLSRTFGRNDPIEKFAHKISTNSFLCKWIGKNGRMSLANKSNASMVLNMVSRYNMHNKRNHFLMIKYLISLGANIEEYNLSQALRNGWVNVLEYFYPNLYCSISAIFDKPIKNENKFIKSIKFISPYFICTILQYSLKHSYKKITKYIEKNFNCYEFVNRYVYLYAKPNSYELMNKSSCLLEEFIKHDNLPMIKYLVKKSLSKKFILRTSIKHHALRICRWIVRKGYNNNKYINRAFIFGVKSENILMIEFALDNGADINFVIN